MTQAKLIALSMVGAAVVVACGASSSNPKVPNSFARRAAFDLNCPVEQLGYVPIKTTTPRTTGVVGCNKRVTYAEVCSIAMYGLLRSESCQWMMSGAIQQDDAPTASASATPTPPATPAPPGSAPAQ